METIEKAKKKNFFKRIFPQSRSDWKLYFIKTLPIIFAEVIFCLNGFLDNFMVSHLSQGVDSLTYANTWTGLLTTMFFAIQGILSMFVGQYYGKKEYDKINQIMNVRFWMFLFIAFCFALPSWISPNSMIIAVSGKSISTHALANARKYLLLMTAVWLICAYNFNTNMLLIETGHSKYALVSSTLTLLSNCTINAITLFALKKPFPYYAAIGTIISNVICLISDLLFAYFKDRNIFMSPFKLFNITKPIAKQIFRRLPAIIFMIIAMITIPLRMMIWTRGFPESSVGKVWMGISGVTILGLVESLSSVASSITYACSNNVTYFVARHLGRDEFEEAEKHAYALRGFHTICGVISSVLMIGIIYVIAYLPSSAKGVQEYIGGYFANNNNLASINNEYNLSLSNVSELQPSFILERITEGKNFFRTTFINSCYVFIGINPIWCWFYTTSALIRAGGKNYLSSITTFTANILSFGWLLIIVFVLKRYFPSLSLPLAYFLFFGFDFVRLIVYEIIALKCNWMQNITIEGMEKDPSYHV
ncbi:MATE family efflux transporter [Metamycoplasma orale]|uniref:MATE family efflux transporter n=1 Tax=Metamycoplasma orale TaxID=2121 RepID=UPI0004101A72|nr:MATE family efflux transporter [Metamycoplasma orale]